MIGWSQIAAMILVASSSTLTHRELHPGNFEITGARGEDEFEMRDAEAQKVCPGGYESMSDVQVTKADGSTWRWEIRCWISENITRPLKP